MIYDYDIDPTWGVGHDMMPWIIGPKRVLLADVAGGGRTLQRSGEAGQGRIPKAIRMK